jgi:SAM-dependent methyltransferase
MGKKAQQTFFDQTSAGGTRESLRGFYAINKPVTDYCRAHLRANVIGKRVLEYGCGSGAYALFIAKCGAEQVFGIDLSPVRIAQAEENAARTGLENTAFQVMDAEAMTFESEYFDFVFGGAILHHLQLDKALSEVARVMKPGGDAMFVEPMGYNPAINLFRTLTPRHRVEDEHPFKRRDLRLINTTFQQVNHRFFHLFTLLAVPFRKTRQFPWLLDRLSAIDRGLFEKIPVMGLLAWQVIITAKKVK